MRIQVCFGELYLNYSSGGCVKLNKWALNQDKVSYIRRCAITHSSLTIFFWRCETTLYRTSARARVCPTTVGTPHHKFLVSKVADHKVPHKHFTNNVCIKGDKSCPSVNCESVSYTHLDVYKRQVYNCNIKIFTYYCRSTFRVVNRCTVDCLEEFWNIYCCYTMLSHKKVLHWRAATVSLEWVDNL